MPFVDPNTIHNPAAGTVAPSSWGDTVRDDLVFLSSPPRGVVSHGSTVSHATSGSWQTITAATVETKDTDGAHSIVTNTGRVTIVTAGDYRFEAVIEWASNATGVRGTKFLKNGATDYLGTLFASAAGSIKSTASALVTGLIAGDYIETAGFQNSGGALNMQLIRYSWLYVGT